MRDRPEQAEALDLRDFALRIATVFRARRWFAGIFARGLDLATPAIPATYEENQTGPA